MMCLATSPLPAGTPASTPPTTLLTVEIPWPDQRVFSLSLNHLPQLGTVVALNDITYLKELDALKSSFVEMVSHDLKNPLAALHGYATLVGMETLSEQGRANLNHLLAQAEQTQNLITNLLDLTRLEAGLEEEVEACDLAEIAADVVSGFELAATQKELTLNADFPSGLPPVMGNPMRLFQVISNLVGAPARGTP